MTREVTVTTGSRLHFGLIGWGPQHERQFGGVGVMIEPPVLTIKAAPAPEFVAIGPLAERVQALAQRLVRHWQLPTVPSIRLEISSAPPEHVGLGAGTALALAVASVIAEFLQRGQPSREELALATGRGLRSAVGAHGFRNGGLIFEDGKVAGEVLGRLQARINLPSEWRFVLIGAFATTGLSGGDERRAFKLVPSTPLQTSTELLRIAETQIVPAARAGDFENFATAVADYNRLAGSCFAAVQGGNYASAEIAELIAALQHRGIPGAGQSSWGPTVFALVPHGEAAKELAAWLKRERDYGADRVSVVSVRACR